MRAHLFTLVTSQYHLGILRFLVLERDAQTTKNHQCCQFGFDDQHGLMRWLQDSAAGLDLDKESAILFGHDVGGRSLCHYLLRLFRSVDKGPPLCVAVIMQSGFCDDIQDT